MRRHPLLACTPLIAVLVLALLAPTYAALNAIPRRSPVVAMVNLEKVFNDIQRRADAEGELEKKSMDFRKKAETMRSETELRKQDLDLLVPGTPQYDKAEDEWKTAVVNYSAFVEFTKAKLDQVRANARREIYDFIMERAENFAANNGIDIILSSDATFEIMEGTDLQIVQQLAMRRVVFGSTEFDVTDDLISWINR